MMTDANLNLIKLSKVLSPDTKFFLKGHILFKKICMDKFNDIFALYLRKTSTTLVAILSSQLLPSLWQNGNEIANRPYFDPWDD